MSEEKKDVVEEAVKETVEAAEEVAEEVANEVDEVVEEVTEEAKEDAKEVSDAVEEVADQVDEAAEEDASEIKEDVEKVKEKAKEVAEKAKEDIEKAKEDVKEVAEKVKEDVKEAAEDAKEKVEEAVEDVKEKIAEKKASKVDIKAHELIKDIEDAQIKEVADFNVGDTIKVSAKIVEGSRERIQKFEGLCIKKQGGGNRTTFTVRKESNGVGVEKTWPLYSPTVAKIEVVRPGKVRRAKLNYIKDRTGKAAKVKELVK